MLCCMLYVMSYVQCYAMLYVLCYVVCSMLCCMFFFISYFLFYVLFSMTCCMVYVMFYVLCYVMLYVLFYVVSHTSAICCRIIIAIISALNPGDRMALATCRSKVTIQFDCLPSHLMTLKAIPLLCMILTFEEELRSRFLKHVNKN
jgi:hypothetical protein